MLGISNKEYYAIRKCDENASVIIAGE